MGEGSVYRGGGGVKRKSSFRWIKFADTVSKKIKRVNERVRQALYDTVAKRVAQ